MYTRSLLQQLHAELAARAPAADAFPVFDPTALLYDQQRVRVDAVQPRSLSAWPAGRRSGKTDAASKLLTTVSTSRPGTQAFYLNTTIKRAVATVWHEVVKLNEDHDLGGTPNWSTHTIVFPSGSRLIVTGCESKKMANDLRGRKDVALYFIDECQDWDDELLRYLYESVIFPSLADVRGAVVFAGTGSAPRGFWHEVATSDPAFRRFPEWTAFNNPFPIEAPIQDEAAVLVAKACRDRGVDVTDPGIQREWFARFVVDSQTQIFPYDRARNGFDRGAWDHGKRRWIGGDLPGGSWSYVLAGDFGSVDAFGWVVLGWTDADARIWVLETDAQRGLGSSAQVSGMAAVAERYGDRLIGIVGDPGGGGASHIIDLRQQHWIPIEAAEKSDKASACITMRDGLRTGRLMIATAEGPFVNEMGKPEWDPHAVGSVIRGHFPDRVDACLYGWRKAAALHHFAPPAPSKTVAEQLYEHQEQEEARLHALGLL